MKIINKSYGSIPHLSTSKMGKPADKKIDSGREAYLTIGSRKGDTIIVTEKVDGSNVGVIKKDGVIYAITRSGYTCESSEYVQHHAFDKYVKNNIARFSWLPEGWRVCGEWCIMAHGTLMDITGEHPFLAFDIMDANGARLTYSKFCLICAASGIRTTPLLYIGNSALPVLTAINIMGSGHYGKPEKPEGCVWRCERDGYVDYLAKWVQPDKIDGKYMADEIYHPGAEQYLK